MEPNRNGEVLIFAEQEDGALSDVPLELLSKGRELADILQVPLACALVGDEIGDLAQTLIRHGADKVYVADDPRLKNYQTASYAKVVGDLIVESRPQICVFGATAMGRDLAPTVASAQRCGLTADCTDLQIGNYTDPSTKQEHPNLLLQVRPAFGGNIIATIVNPYRWPQMATVREGVMQMTEADAARQGEVVSLEVQLEDLKLPVEVLQKLHRPRKVNLKAARIIVAGGAGVGSRENFRLIRDLANVLGGAVGASRAAVDLGYIENDHQVGQTGTTVRPALYIACGLSGAVQHRAGMQESAKILAINNDREATIFGVAHYGIVGDLNEVIPMMIKAIRGGATLEQVVRRHAEAQA
jgi:electron transfer flavoprotein alpha subunit